MPPVKPTYQLGKLTLKWDDKGQCWAEFPLGLLCDKKVDFYTEQAIIDAGGVKVEEDEYSDISFMCKHKRHDECYKCQCNCHKQKLKEEENELLPNYCYKSPYPNHCHGYRTDLEEHKTACVFCGHVLEPQPKESEPRSKCCGAEMKIVGGDEGTVYYQCLECGNGCDPKTEREEIKMPNGSKIDFPCKDPDIKTTTGLTIIDLPNASDWIDAGVGSYAWAKKVTNMLNRHERMINNNPHQPPIKKVHDASNA